MAEKIERIYTVNLRGAYNYPRTFRARRAVKMLRSFLARNMKAGEEDVSISGSLNSQVWQNGMEKPPARVKVRVVKDDKGVFATLFGEEEKAQAKAKKKEEKRKASLEKRKGRQKKAKPAEKGQASKTVKAPAAGAKAEPAAASQKTAAAKPAEPAKPAAQKKP